MRHIIPLAICALIQFNAGCEQYNASLQEDAPHSWPGEEWETASLAAENIDPFLITRFVEEIKTGQYGLVDHFLLIRNGRVVVDERFERDYQTIAAEVRAEDKIGLNKSDPKYNYENADYHPYYNGTNLHSLQSVSKSVTSLALGIAIDKGYIEGVDAHVLAFFDSYDFDRSDPRKVAMTVSNLLTMRSGIAWETEGGFQDPKVSTVSLENSDKWLQFILDHPMDTDPGTSFEYNDGVSVLLGKIVAVATEQRLDRWTIEHLFDPIGIETHYWKTTPDGEIDSMGGLYLSAHDLARIGLLVLRDGLWLNKRVVSEEWVRQSTLRHVDDTSPNTNDDYTGYAYQWWLPSQKIGEAKAISAIGFGGQRLTIIPELDLVIVFNGWDLHGEYWAAEQAFREKVLPEAVRE